MPGWRFFLDRGGTFTDLVAFAPDGTRRVAKVLSLADAETTAMRRLAGEDLSEQVDGVRMGTTVATNALLERHGEPLCLAITKGFGDALVIGRQDRPELFELEIVKPEPLHARVVEIAERVMADGSVRSAPAREAVLPALVAAREAGCRALAVVLVHGFAHPAHERIVAEWGREAGFEQVSLSSQVAPEIGLVGRGDTTCADAALTPLLTRHLAQLRQELGPGPELRLMASSGGLADAASFSGKDAILSGPAGGVVALAEVAQRLGYEQALGFDMGGTSTDVSRWSQQEGFERVYERTIAGLRVRAPMLDIVTVAAGGGSVLESSGRRFSVGPESAGAAPGPAGYGRGGPAAVTDANAVLGRIQADWFPTCFGGSGDAAFDLEASRGAIACLAESVGLGVEEAAAGFLRIANENMAAAIRQVSTARGRDPRDHALVCFGGAGAQHACAIADLLEIRTVLLHPLAGVLSALGMGLADLTCDAVEPVLAPLDQDCAAKLERRASQLAREQVATLETQGADRLRTRSKWGLDLRNAGVEHALHVPVPDGARTPEAWRAAFEERHERLYGFVKEGAALEAVALRVESSGGLDAPEEPVLPAATAQALPATRASVAFAEPDGSVRRRDCPVYERAGLRPGHELTGPALVVEEVSTVLLEPGWNARVEARGELVLERAGEPEQAVTAGGDAVELEVYANRFMSIAEQMGETLRRVSCSTNIKERLDYSCALFTRDGRLVANAPHVPVHLGAMGETVRAILDARGLDGLRAGQAVASNDPFHGGSHLPDVTVVSPVFVGGELAYFVANRGHHSDVGGTRPGSMPPDATSIEEEGLRFHDVTLVEDGVFAEAEMRTRLGAGPWPVRDPEEMISDLRSQVAANAVGARLLSELCERDGRSRIDARMNAVLEDAAEATRELLAELPQGTHRFEDALDDGSPVVVRVEIGEGEAVFDFSGTARQLPGNLNAPRVVTTAAVLFVLRSLVRRRIPLNAGTLVPVSILIPRGCLLDPSPPAAVAGGNVETSQRIADVLLGALGALAASQGTMNNLTFGTESWGFYETIGGGAGAGPGFPGASGVHVHLTNTRITDAEVLERRYPVLLREFALRRGSGGAGAQRGGDGLVREIEFLEALEVAMLSERRERAPFGLEGGEAGLPGCNRILRSDGSVQDLGGKGRTRVRAGDRIRIETPGGGGFGTPG
jgi:5-oxoprolinase (ATP-hydrolysing)